MYIPEFWCGFILGAVTMIVLIIAIVVWYNRKDKG